MHSGAEIIIKALADNGVDTIFGYPGGAVLPLYDALFQQSGIRHILVRHEQAAVHAAEGYARSTGKVGVVLVTSGPGATNAVTGLTDALLDSIPIICLTGQVATHLIGSDAFQEADTVGITRSCTKHNYLVTDVTKLAGTVHEAFHVASTGRPGPVVIDIPKNVQFQQVEYTKSEERRASYKVAARAGEDAVAQAAEMIMNAHRPVFYTGGGVINSGEQASQLLRELVRKTGFPCTSTLMGLGGFPASDDLFLGMLGMHGTYEANMAMARCDLMINVGARFDDRITGRIDGFSPDSRKIHIDIDASSINKNIHVDLPLVGDAATVLQQLLDKLEGAQFNAEDVAPWWEQIARWRSVNCLEFGENREVARPQYVLSRLNEALRGKDFYMSTDVGQHQMWTAQYINFDEPNRWLTSGGLGTMGYGVPAAVGAQIAHPDKTVVCITGEASVLMNIQELSTISQYRLPVKIIILNNQYMGMVRQWQELFHGNRYSQSYMEALPDFVALAEAFGLRGIRAKDAGGVDGAIADALAHEGPVLVDIHTDRGENVYPMIPAGAAHHEIKLHPSHEGRARALGEGDVAEIDPELAKSQV